MRPVFLIAAILAVLLANMLVFGALSTRILQPTPRPSHLTPHATFTPHSQPPQRRVTFTPTPLPTATEYPTIIPLKDPRGPIGRPDEWF